MFSFALLKAARLGYIDAKYGDAGRRAYDGVLKEFIEVDKDGLVNIHRVCQVAGLGGDPEKGERYRDGTYEYYVNEKIRSNDPKGCGTVHLRESGDGATVRSRDTPSDCSASAPYSPQSHRDTEGMRRKQSNCVILLFSVCLWSVSRASRPPPTSL